MFSLSPLYPPPPAPFDSCRGIFAALMCPQQDASLSNSSRCSSLRTHGSQFSPPRGNKCFPDPLLVRFLLGHIRCAHVPPARRFAIELVAVLLFENPRFSILSSTGKQMFPRPPSCSIPAGAYSLRSCAPSKNRTCIYPLGRDCSIH